MKYKLINNKNNTYVSGTLDQHGRTRRLSSDHNDDYDILIGTEEDWTVSVDDGLDDEDAFEYLCVHMTSMIKRFNDGLLSKY